MYWRKGGLRMLHVVSFRVCSATASIVDNVATRFQNIAYNEIIVRATTMPLPLPENMAFPLTLLLPQSGLNLIASFLDPASTLLPEMVLYDHLVRTI